MTEGRFDHCLGGRMAVFPEQLLFEGTGIDSDPDRYQPLSRGLNYLLDLPPLADIAGIQPQGIDALLQHFQCKFVVEMYVSYDRDTTPCPYLSQSQRGIHVRDRTADDLAPGIGKPGYLGKGRLRITGIGRAH